MADHAFFLVKWDFWSQRQGGFETRPYQAMVSLLFNVGVPAY